jgi:hypothetical protein
MSMEPMRKVFDAPGSLCSSSIVLSGDPSRDLPSAPESEKEIEEIAESGSLPNLQPLASSHPCLHMGSPASIDGGRQI